MGADGARKRKIAVIAALAAAVLLLALLEHRAEQLGIGHFRWYTPAQLQAVIAESTALPEEPRRPLLRSRPLEAAEILAAALPLLG